MASQFQPTTEAVMSSHLHRWLCVHLLLRYSCHPASQALRISIRRFRIQDLQQGGKQEWNAFAAVHPAS